MDEKIEMEVTKIWTIKNDEGFLRVKDTRKKTLLTFSREIMLDNVKLWIVQQVTRFIDSETICEQSRSLTFIKSTE